MITKWAKGQTVRVNGHYGEWSDKLPTVRYDGVIRSSPKVGDEGVILNVDKQGDAWVDFGDGEPDGWIMNPGWADVIKKEISNFEDLAGSTLTDIMNTDDEIVFTLDDSRQYKLYHSQSCCEHVYIEDINGDLNDLIGSSLTMAEEVSNPEIPENFDPEEHDSYTWTFYKLATAKGYVTIRWFGSSNGYYSERVDFKQV